MRLDGELVEVAEEQATLSPIRRDYRDGKSLRAIAETLNAEGAFDDVTRRDGSGELLVLCDDLVQFEQATT
jgi:hypothetical protein